MKKLKQIHKSVFRHEFSEKQMRAYFTKDDRLKVRLLWVSVLLAISCLILVFLDPGNIMIWLFTGIIACLVSLTILLILRFGVYPPSDEEYDTWVSEKAREALRKELGKLGQDLLEEEIDHIPFIHGFVLKGTNNALHYRAQDLYWKWGKDKIQRYSINVFRYFHEMRNQLAVVIIDINAVNQHDKRAQNHEYYYADVVAVTTVDERDFIEDANGKHDYRTQTFELRISDGKSVSATIRSQPLDYEQKLDTFELPSSEDVEETISRLRMLIRRHKQGPNLERD